MPPCHLYINVSDLYVSARSLGNLCRRLVGGWKRTEFSGRCVCGSESNKWEFPGLMSEVETKKIKWKIDWQFYCQWRRREKSFISNNCQDEAKLGKLRQMHHLDIGNGKVQRTRFETTPTSNSSLSIYLQWREHAFT